MLIYLVLVMSYFVTVKTERDERCCIKSGRRAAHGCIIYSNQNTKYSRRKAEII